MKVLYFALFSLCPIWGQITQSRPEYCGIPGGVNPPLPEISASIDEHNDHSMLYIGQGGKAVELPGYFISEISEVCPLADGRMVVFGGFGGIGINGPIGVAVYVIANASVVDRFSAYRPVVMSPNQRWIVYVKSYPLHGVLGSDEFMLYDLTKTPAQNRPVAEVDEPGTLIFPPGHQNFAGSNILDNPNDQVALYGVSQPHWTPDSCAIVFKDVTDQTGSGIVLIQLDEQGAASVFRHRLTLVEICGHAVQHEFDARPGDPRGVGPHWQVDRGEIGTDGIITVDVTSACGQHTLELRHEDFQPAAPELHVKPTTRRKTVQTKR